MRIEFLRMKNFLPIFVALDKTEVTLDYRPVRDKVINIFVGQMGTCKTFLLGHHQPFATLGTLDVRNAEDMVIPEKRGLKEITYSHNGDIFEIVHHYIPTKNGGHTIKSYFKRNGNELNENGNNNSFKSLVEDYFGLEQNFLKLFRIGSNVINLPDMQSADRKNFVSSMLSDTDVYQMLAKKVSDDNRSLNAQMTILINKLQNLSKKSEEDLLIDQDAERVIVHDTQVEIDGCTEEIYRLDGLINGLRNGETEDAYQVRYATLSAQYTGAVKEADALAEQIAAARENCDPDAISKAIATCSAMIELRRAQMAKLAEKIKVDDLTRSRLRDKLAVTASADHIATLRKTYSDLTDLMSDYERKLKHFTYTGSLGSIMSLITELEHLNGVIVDLAQYDPDIIKEIMRNPKGAIARSEHAIRRAQAEKDRIQQEMSNISAATTYRSTHLMMRPFNCPTIDCPYYQYHPLTEQAKNRKINVDKVFLEKRNQIKQLEATIYRYEEYPNLARKIETARTLWKAITPQVKPLGALKEDDLQEVITNLLHREWYDLDRLNRIKELCGIREKYYQLMERMNAMRTELAQYEMNDTDTLQKEYAECCKRYEDELVEMEGLEDANRADETRLRELNEDYIRISSIESMEARKNALESDIASLSSEINQIEENRRLIDGYKAAITELRNRLSSLKTEFKAHSIALDNLTHTISEIRQTKEHYSEVLTRQAIVHDILDAVSSKKGIPLVFVRLFLMDCKDALNDLISDVFDDSIEIEKFDIPDDGSEFNIPYTRNGALISDIIKASQGERAVIALALSFALIRQAGFGYNIMLLDEVDGPLHKSARNKFITILFKQLQAIQAEQVFLVSHNNTFDGFNVNIIMTSDENVDENPLTTIMRIA